MQRKLILLTAGLAVSYGVFTSLNVAHTVPAANTEQSVSTQSKPVTPEVSRGQLLYENHCPVCHDSTAHIRKDRRAASVSELNAWVLRWSTELKLNWQAEEIQSVVDYLNSRYYKFTAK